MAQHGTSQTNRARPIVVGVDPTADSLTALTTGAALAQQHETSILVVHVRHEPSLASETVVASEAAAMRTALDEMEATTRRNVSDVMAGRQLNWHFVVTSGDPASELIRQAVENDAATIVVGGRNHGVLGGLVQGSVAQKLVRKSPVSVLVVRDGQAHRVKEATASPAHPLTLA
jgi:nucleotide-binding universal stress UspA family protein